MRDMKINNEEKNALLRSLPSVCELLDCIEVQPLLKKFGRPILKFVIQSIIKERRVLILEGKPVKLESDLLQRIFCRVHEIVGGSLKRVINGTGILLHTNLGRAPLSQDVMQEVSNIIGGYSNLEFNLQTGKRGNRNAHLKEMLRVLTGGENSLVVNNTAAALLLILSTFAKGKEVIVSRGELVEIGGSFRVPDILEQSGAKMVEVGTTNRTRLSDYENAITENTAFLLKIHKSNYKIQGFTEEVSPKELSALGQRKGIKLLYDLGSGLLQKHRFIQALKNEPDVQSALSDGCDLVAFSGDKLLGGPQAGIVVGAGNLISKLEKEPLFRALRVDKMCYAALHVICKKHLLGKMEEDPIALFKMMETPIDMLKLRAERLINAINSPYIQLQMVGSIGQYGGGTLPDHQIQSYAVEISSLKKEKVTSMSFSERLNKALLKTQIPVVSILREGKLFLDVLTLQEDEIPIVAQSIEEALQLEIKPR